MFEQIVKYSIFTPEEFRSLMQAAMYKNERVNPQLMEQTQTISVECPAYIGNIHEESAIISKLREDFASGRVKSVHHE